jgi:lysophospholipase L1-like esterase
MKADSIRWTVLALVTFFIADGLIFRTGWYNRYLEPDSSAGSLEAQLHWLKESRAPKGREVLVIGDSRIAEGFSARTANSTTDQRINFWNFGLGGTTPRVWYYTLRDADPTRRRFAAIAIALDNYSDADWFAEFEDRATDQNYLVMRLGLGDCLGFAMSMHEMAARQHALFGCLFRGMILRNDVQTFLAHPEARLTHAADWLQNGLGYNSGYGGMTENLRGLSVNWSNRSIQFPDGVSDATRANVTKFVLRDPVAQTGEVARYRWRWLGGILDLYQDSPTRLIFLQLPRAPLIDPMVPTERKTPRFVDSATKTPRVNVLPAGTFEDLERPEFFADGLHLNHDGRPIFSERLARQVDAILGSGH